MRYNHDLIELTYHTRDTATKCTYFEEVISMLREVIQNHAGGSGTEGKVTDKTHDHTHYSASAHCSASNDTATVERRE
jgi:hypothetical protein